MFGFEKTYLLQKPVALKKSIECNTSFMSCFAVDPNVLAQSKKVHQKMKFTHEEDEQLRRLVKVFGDNSWSEVASCMPGRNKRQCKERWTNYLSPTVNNAPWTVAEDSLLLQKTRRAWSQVGENLEVFPWQKRYIHQKQMDGPRKKG